MLIIKLIDEHVVEQFRKLCITEWDSSRAEVIAYREKLLVAQNWKCAYCRRPIYRDELGFRELDHVLPKSQSPSKAEDFDLNKARSNNRKDRRHTLGFADFMYIPENLVIACKRCNSHKGSYDGLADRTLRPIDYPSSSDDFEWINPHFDVPDGFLEILPGFIYTATNDSEKGKAVIHACGLDKSEGLSARALDHIVVSQETLTKSLLAAILSPENFTNRDIAIKLDEKYGGIGVDILEECVAIIRAATSNTETLATALLEVGGLIT
ncbi:HNH endonuclease [Burkholderia cepacia]|uniref:HNH endonuclease n=1 Tax=Burkholderia cepacia TaxID=292 RepID=UPI002FE04BC0